MMDTTELKRSAEAALQPEVRPMGRSLKMASFYSLATPAAVLELIDENTRNAKNAAEWEAASLHWMAERDQLKAENAALRKDAVFHSHTQRQAELYQNVQLAAGSLPDGWEIRLYIEKHSGYVELFNPDGDEFEDFASNRESLAETISDALEAAIAKEAGHDQV